MSDDMREDAQKLASDLEKAGHAEHAADVRQALSEHPVEDGFLWTLRNICDTFLTAAEAIDPVLEITLERLRSRLDSTLTRTKP